MNQQLVIILKGCAHVMLELYLLVIVGVGGTGREYLIHWGLYTITGLGVILLSCQRVSPLSI